MTSTSLRGILENGSDADYRNFVSSGLQSMAFGEPLSGEGNESAKGYSWRMVVEASSNLKLVCCKNTCPGAPSTIVPENESGFTIALYDTIADPFDQHPLNVDGARAEDVDRLIKMLPASFGCTK